MKKLIRFSSLKFKKNHRYIKKIILGFLAISAILILLSYKININYLKDEKPTPKEVIRIDGDFNGELLLNDNFNDGIFTEKIIESIKNAKKTIYIAIYSMNNTEIINLLNQKSVEGLDVKVLLPSSKKSQYEILYKNLNFETKLLGTKFFEDENENFMHHKFILIDHDLDSRKLYFGSANLTYLQEAFDTSFILKTIDQEVIKTFSSEFYRLYSQGRGVNKFKQKDYSPFAKRIEYNNGFFEIWFSPGFLSNSIKTRTIELIKSAQTEIKIVGWRINDREIFNNIVKKLKEGVTVKILIDDAYLWTDVSVISDLVEMQDKYSNLIVESDSYNTIYIKDYLAGRENYDVENFNPYVHRHSLIVDQKILLSGTNNWSLNGFERNDESIFVSNVEWLVKEYNNSFDLNFDKLNQSKIDFSLIENKLTLIDQNNLIDSQKLKLIIYVEKSYPDIIGEKCFEKDIFYIKQDFEIPKECLNQRLKLFIVNKNGELFLNEYLNL